MKKRKIKSEIAGRLKKIGRHCKKISKHYNVEDIHKMRVEVKKLRAFMQLTSAAFIFPLALKLPKDLKSVYKKAGEIRDIHLHLERLDQYVQQNSGKLTEYHARLQKRSADARKDLGKLLSDNPARSARKKIFKQLPKSLDKQTISTFIQHKIIIIVLLTVNQHKNEEDLHNIRKNLKELMYDISFFEKDPQLRQHGTFFDQDQLKMIDEVGQKLGNLNDLHTTESFMDEQYMEGLADDEKNRLEEATRQWTDEKERLRQEIMQALSDMYHSILIKK